MGLFVQEHWQLPLQPDLTGFLPWAESLLHEKQIQTQINQHLTEIMQPGAHCLNKNKKKKHVKHNIKPGLD